MPQHSKKTEEFLDTSPVPWMHGAAGITAGALSMTLFYPLDLIRTRLHAQTGDVSRFRGAQRIAQEEGFRGLYRGVKIAVASHSVGWGLYLTVFRSFQQAFSRTKGDSAAGDFIAACCAAVVTSTLVTPLNLLKTRAQLQEGQTKQASLSSRVSTVLATEGPQAFLRGVGPQILLSFHTTIQVALYECIKRQLWGKDDAPMTGVACVSGLSKAIASTVCNPLEVCRTRLQDKRNAGNPAYASMSAAFRTIWKNEGAVGLYRGVGVNVMRVVPTTVVAFVIYEKTLHGMSWAFRTTRTPAVTAPSS